MTKKLINNLGTIANSGTKNLLNHYRQEQMLVVLQFGVFLFRFLVADKVEVISNIMMIVNIVGRQMPEVLLIFPNHLLELNGTKLVLHLKDDQKEYLEENKIRELIKHSNIGYQFLFVSKTVEKEVEDDTEEVVEEDIDGDENDAPKIEEVEEEDSDKPKNEKISETIKNLKN